MKVIIYGATGMVGHGVLRECLLAPDVEQVLCVGRRPCGQRHAKLRDIILKDFVNYTPIEQQLAGYDACFFCLGGSSAGMTEQAYVRMTYDFALAAARALLQHSPEIIFIFVSGMGTDSSERSRMIWARIKGRTENALLQLPFRSAYMFRPGFIKPMHGAVPGTRRFKLLYAFIVPLYPILNAVVPNIMTTTEKLGRAMLRVVRSGASIRVLENRDINALAKG